MPTALAAVIAVAAIGATYLFCVRPMIRGRGHCAPGAGLGPDAEVDRQVTALREELRILRAQDSQDSGPVPSGTPSPPD